MAVLINKFLNSNGSIDLLKQKKIIETNKNYLITSFTSSRIEPMMVDLITATKSTEQNPWWPSGSSKGREK